MRRILKTLAAIFILVLALGTVAVSAAEKQNAYETSIKNLIKDIRSFEWEALARFSWRQPEVDEISYGSSKAWMAEVAALSITPKESDLIRTEDVDGGYIEYYTIKDKDLKKKAKNIFGKTITVNDLLYIERDYLTEAYRTFDEGAILKSEFVETETGIYERDFSVKKKGKKYTVTKKVYFGYWGAGEYGEEANYQITYTFKDSSKSSYGLVLTGMKIKLI